MAERDDGNGLVNRVVREVKIAENLNRLASQTATSTFTAALLDDIGKEAIVEGVKRRRHHAVIKVESCKVQLLYSIRFQDREQIGIAMERGSRLLVDSINPLPSECVGDFIQGAYSSAIWQGPPSLKLPERIPLRPENHLNIEVIVERSDQPIDVS